MPMFRCPSTALLIKDEARNVFYELEDPRDVQDRCVIKIYCKEPVYGTYSGHHNPHLANGDLRVRVEGGYLCLSVSQSFCLSVYPSVCVGVVRHQEQWSLKGYKDLNKLSTELSTNTEPSTPSP